MNLKPLVPRSVKRAGRRVQRPVTRARHRVASLREVSHGRRFAEGWNARAGQLARDTTPGDQRSEHPLLCWFQERDSGRGINKWLHYFEVYERHLERFVGQDVQLLEVGIQSGGSLEMWRQFLGGGASIYGVDIDPGCRRSEQEGVTVFIGDQADRAFWACVRAETPPLNVVVDDGGHTPEQQRVTLEELLPHLAVGGVYMCEDLHGDRNRFLYYIHGLSQALCAGKPRASPSDPKRSNFSKATPYQAAVHSIHLYPHLVVIERRDQPLDEFVSLKQGIDWL
jgi:hypothetical protein